MEPFLKTILVFSFLLLALPELAMSAREPTKLAGDQQNVHEMSKHLRQMRIHGFLLWASMGFLMPVAVLAIRMSSHVQCGKTLRMLFYSHVIVQMVAIFLAIAGAVLAVESFENAFNNAHQRVGLALYALMLLQLLLGFCRTHRRGRGRMIWYFLHWFSGTGLCIMAIVTVYLGLHAYHAKTQEESTRIWTILFTAEVSVVGFVYLLQDRWDYVMKQGTTIPGHEQITPADHLATHPPRIAMKVVGDVRNGAA
ncbi:hypothetical protein Taro_020814 [Colocasia esculenta]|uniref:Cytochrome b561 domain-containing protein n=1 Tax=Colocasia esculenta TaxID=4460 RepID=A0A843V3I0_COLES|nr:hypothetical protein [Colocasia esculenta]